LNFWLAKNVSGMRLGVERAIIGCSGQSLISKGRRLLWKIQCDSKEFTDDVSIKSIA
jgi:hypothetical protein